MAETGSPPEGVVGGPMAGRVAVVTGCNTGIGKKTVLGLARLGMHVVLACRSNTRAMAAMDDITRDAGRPVSLECLTLDLSSFASVRGFARELLHRHPRLHVLVNNAGMNSFSRDPENAMTRDGFEIVAQVNYLGHYLLTELLLDSLKAAATPEAPTRIVNMSSVTHRKVRAAPDFHRSFREVTDWSYSNSKLAGTLHAYELQRRLRTSGDDNVLVFAVNPGSVYSDIWRDTPPMLRCGLRVASACLMLNTEQGAATSIAAATADDLEGGQYLSPYRVYGCCPELSDSVGPFIGYGVAPSAELTYDEALQDACRAASDAAVAADEAASDDSGGGAAR